MTFRKKAAAKVYDEILTLSKRYKCLRLAATDNILANEYFTELLPRLAELNVDLELFYEVKANLRREQLTQMAAAGIVTDPTRHRELQHAPAATDAEGRHRHPEHAVVEVVPRNGH